MDALPRWLTSFYWGIVLGKPLTLKILGHVYVFGISKSCRICSEFLFVQTKKEIVQVTRSPHRPSPSFLPNAQSARQSYVARYPNPWSERGDERGERCEGQRWGTNVVKGQTHRKVMGGYFEGMKANNNL